MSKTRVCIYIDETEWQEFLKIARREGKNGSLKLEEFIKNYNEEHKHGNPQLKINSYLEGDKEPTPIHVLCNHLNGSLSNGRIHCTKKGVWLKSIRCYSCRHNRLIKRDEYHHRLPDGKLVRCS